MKSVQKAKPRLVYVDDQKENLVTFEAHLSEDWEIKSYLRAIDALNELSEFKPAIILSDMRMGQINGVEFLLKSKEILPNAVRIIITGYADEQLLIAAVRYAQVFDYIQKPYDAKDLEVRLQKAYDHFKQSEKVSQEVS